LPASASRIAASSGAASRASSAAAEMIIPLVQYPHCIASSAMNASCTGCSVSPFARPSIVVISWSAAWRTGMRHDATPRPSTMT
jgi:hypothetical protein